jgi:hypothetical protein
MLKLAAVSLGGIYLVGLMVVAAGHVIDRFAFNWSLGLTVVHGVIGSLDWPLRLLG